MARKDKQNSEAQPAKITDCFFAPRCMHPAKLRTDRYIKPGDFQALCQECDQRLHEERSERWCAEQGLHTREQRIAYCLTMAGSNRILKSMIDELAEKDT